MYKNLEWILSREGTLTCKEKPARLRYTYVWIEWLCILKNGGIQFIIILEISVAYIFCTMRGALLPGLSGCVWVNWRWWTLENLGYDHNYTFLRFLPMKIMTSLDLFIIKLRIVNKEWKKKSPPEFSILWKFYTLPFHRSTKQINSLYI